MSTINFTPEEKSRMVDQVKRYFNDELNQDIGSFDAEFLIDFFATQMGGYFYNRGVSEAQQLLASKIEDITDSFYELEKPTDIKG